LASLPKAVVLVVEDHPIVRACMVEALVEACFEALAVGDAGQAIAMLETRPDIGLVFTETAIPEPMDGLTLARCIRERWPPVKLIVVSGRVEFAQGYLPAGTVFFPKPYRDKAIVEEMVGLLFPS
jgi:CheY-like chemotaxis protein